MESLEIKLDFIAFTTGFIFGEMVLALEAYFLRDWVTLQLVAYSPMLILLGLYFVLPESTRWLIARGTVIQSN